MYEKFVVHEFCLFSAILESVSLANVIIEIGGNRNRRCDVE